MGSKRWREAAVETDKQALGSQTTLQGFLVGEETRRSLQYRSYDTVQAKNQCFPTGRDPMPKEGIHRKKTTLGGNSSVSENHRTQVSRASDLKVADQPQKEESARSLNLIRDHKLHDSKFGKTSVRREMITGSTHPRQATKWSSVIDQATSTQDLDDAEPYSAELEIILRPWMPNFQKAS